jgi:predicted dehydrogenase
MKRLRVGVVGCGDVAFRCYLGPMAQFGDKVELVATCDTVATRAEEAKAKFGARTAYTKLEEMLADPDVEAVVSLTPVQFHTSIGLKALRAGKHLYQEKPLAMTVEEADTLVAEAEKSGLLLVCAPATNLMPSRQYGRKLLRDGVVGKVVLATAHGSATGPARWKEYTSDPSWFYQEGVGPLVDTGVYAIDYLVDVLGPAKRVVGMSDTAFPELISEAEGAKGKTIKVRVPDTNALILDFGSATLAVLDSAFNVSAQKGPALEFCGDRGTLVVHHWWEDPALELCPAGGYEWQPVQLPAEFASLPSFAWALGVLHLAECFLEAKKPLLSGARARHVLEIMWAGPESSKRGRPIELRTAL